MEPYDEDKEDIHTMSDERLVELTAHYNNTLLDLQAEMWKRGIP